MIFKELVESIVKDDKLSDSEKIETLKSLFNQKEYPEEFNEFWNKCKDHHINKGISRKDAEKRFNQLCNAGDDPKDIVRGLHYYLKKEQEKGTSSNYIIQPRRFLREKIYKNFINDLDYVEHYYICGYGNKHKKGETCTCI